MLIITADDFGSNRVATNNILACYKNRSITSVGAMVFMEDSERAAESVLGTEMDVGLHVNFTQRFSGCVSNHRLEEFQRKTSAYLLGNKYRPIIYNPILRNQFDYVYKSQCEEFELLYNQSPSHINGHHHMHLCANILFDSIIPYRTKVRRNVYFFPGEANGINRTYRRIIDAWLIRHYTCTDFFFSMIPVNQPQRLRFIVQMAKSSYIELMFHPEILDEYNYLLGEEYLSIIADAPLGNFTETAGIAQGR